jgi:hypothetical protein
MARLQKKRAAIAMGKVLCEVYNDTLETQKLLCQFRTTSMDSIQQCKMACAEIINTMGRALLDMLGLYMNSRAETRALLDRRIHSFEHNWEGLPCGDEHSTKPNLPRCDYLPDQLTQLDWFVPLLKDPEILAARRRSAVGTRSKGVSVGGGGPLPRENYQVVQATTPRPISTTSIGCDIDEITRSRSLVITSTKSLLPIVERNFAPTPDNIGNISPNSSSSNTPLNIDCPFVPFALSTTDQQQPQPHLQLPQPQPPQTTANRQQQLAITTLSFTTKGSNMSANTNTVINSPSKPPRRNTLTQSSFQLRPTPPKTVVSPSQCLPIHSPLSSVRTASYFSRSKAESPPSGASSSNRSPMYTSTASPSSQHVVDLPTLKPIGSMRNVLSSAPKNG